MRSRGVSGAEEGRLAELLDVEVVRGEGGGAGMRLETVPCRLLGEHQGRNVAAAVAAAALLAERGWDGITAAAVREGIAATTLPGRLQAMRYPLPLPQMPPPLPRLTHSQTTSASIEKVYTPSSCTQSTKSGYIVTPPNSRDMETRRRGHESAPSSPTYISNSVVYSRPRADRGWTQSRLRETQRNTMHDVIATVDSVAMRLKYSRITST